MRQWILAAALAGAAQSAAGEVPRGIFNITDWVLYDANCNQILRAVSASRDRPLTAPEPQVNLVLIIYAQGIADAQGRQQGDVIEEMMTACADAPWLTLKEAVQP